VKHEILEENLMQMLLAGDNDVLAKLRKQYEKAEIVSREFTGVGFFTNYSLQNCDDLRIDNKTFQIGDVSAVVAGIKGSMVLCFLSMKDLLQCWRVIPSLLIGGLHLKKK
jgi:hypothetical protein